MQQKIREIKRQLRLSMNGVVSSSMREKGVVCGLNFGVGIPRLRQLASSYFPDALLAENLWKENVRECKILATMIYPPEAFSLADDWVKNITNLELAEQAAMNLFVQIPDAVMYASQWITTGSGYVRISGYLLYTRLFLRGVQIALDEGLAFLSESVCAFRENETVLNQVVLHAIGRYGRQSEDRADQVISFISSDQTLSPDFKERLMEILQSEFEFR